MGVAGLSCWPGPRPQRMRGLTQPVQGGLTRGAWHGGAALGFPCVTLHILVSSSLLREGLDDRQRRQQGFGSFGFE